MNAPTVLLPIIGGLVGIGIGLVLLWLDAKWRNRKASR